MAQRRAGVLYFVSSNDILTAVSVDSAADDLRPGAAKELFPAVFFGNLTYTYDVAADGNRFLIVERTGEQDMRLDVMTNWRARSLHLRRIGERLVDERRNQLREIEQRPLPVPIVSMSVRMLKRQRLCLRDGDRA